MIRLHSTDKLTQLLKVIRGISSFSGSNRRHSLGLLGLCNGFCLLPFQTPGGTKFPQVESVVYMFSALEHKDSQIFRSGTLKSQWSTQLAFLQPLLWKLLGFCIAFFARNTWDVFDIFLWTVTEACSNIEVSLVVADNSRRADWFLFHGDTYVEQNWIVPILVHPLSRIWWPMWTWLLESL